MVVAAVSAVVSYAHMRDLAIDHGESWKATLIPLAVDGMLVAATLAIVSQRRLRRPAGWVPWLGLSLGILASLAANVAAARPELVAELIAAWPPVALAVSIETLVTVLRADPRSTPVSSDGRRTEPVVPEGSVTATDPDVGTADVSSIGTDGAMEGSDPADELLAPDPATELVAQGVGRRKLAAELGVSEHAARKLIAASRNGHPR
jgi:hypothetical protein